MLRLELPPAAAHRSGRLVMGRVVLDIGDTGAGGASTRRSRTASSPKWRTRPCASAVTGGSSEGAERAGKYGVEVRHRERPLLVPVMGVFTVARRGGAVDAGGRPPRGTTADDLPPRPAVACPGLDAFLDAILAGERRSAGGLLAGRAARAPSRAASGCPRSTRRRLRAGDPRVRRSLGSAALGEDADRRGLRRERGAGRIASDQRSTKAGR